MTDSTITLLITNLVLVAGGVTKVIVDELRRRNDRLDREQDRLDREQARLDREQLAKLTTDQLDAIRLAGDRRVKTVVDEVVKTRQVAIKAFKEANGVNLKIESLGLKLTENNTPPPTP